MLTRTRTISIPPSTKERVQQLQQQITTTISTKTITAVFMISIVTLSIGLFYLKTDIESIKKDDVSNSITINFPTSLLENPVLIEVTDEIDSLECEYFVQIGAYGNKNMQSKLRTCCQIKYPIFLLLKFTAVCSLVSF